MIGFSKAQESLPICPEWYEDECTFRLKRHRDSILTMKWWDVDITVDLTGGPAAVCHATLFADSASEAREDGRALLEAVYRSGDGNVTAVRVTPAPLVRPFTVTRMRTHQ